VLIEKILDGLREEAKEYAHQALLKPKTDGDITFHYGSAVGFLKGLTHALQRIEEIHAEEQARERVQEPSQFD
jgi:hypothetical protein